MLRDTLTTVLDVLGLLLVAAGLAFFLWPVIGGAALVCSGALILAGSAFSDRPTRTPRRSRSREASR